MACCVFPGEFGSVMEGLLTQEESVLKVAVKTMKSEWSLKTHPGSKRSPHDIIITRHLLDI